MQTALFSPDPDTCIDERLVLDRQRNVGLRFWPNLLDPERANEFLQLLTATVPWRQEYLQLGGKSRAVPRLQCWMGDPGSGYGYSGMKLTPQPWLDPVLLLKQQTEAATGKKFNSVLLNLYRDGQDSVSWHADDERALGPNAAIASISLGAARQFQLKPKTRSSRCSHRILLPSGSLLLMEEGLQNRWLHQLPKAKGLEEPRINLTFRHILGASELSGQSAQLPNRQKHG